MIEVGGVLTVEGNGDADATLDGNQPTTHSPNECPEVKEKRLNPREGRAGVGWGGGVSRGGERRCGGGSNGMK